MAKKTVAAQLVDVLAEAGVRRIYGVAGDSLNGITDSIRKTQQLEWAHMRNEEVAAFAAGAEAHLTGKLAVCAGSCGPGNLHLINGLYDCHRSRVPVLAIAAQIPSSEIGSGYFQETHPTQLFAECSHYCDLASHPERIRALPAQEFIEYDSPFDVGMTGLLGFSSGYHAMMNCDVLLMLGTDFPYRQFFPTDAKIIQIDVRGEQLGKRARLDYGYVGDVKTTLGALLPKLRQNGRDEHLQKSGGHHRKTARALGH